MNVSPSFAWHRWTLPIGILLLSVTSAISVASAQPVGLPREPTFDASPAPTNDITTPLVEEEPIPTRNLLEVIRDGLKIKSDLKIIVLTGYGSIATATDAIRLGALQYLPKPADVDDILNAFSRDPGSVEDVEDDDFVPPSLARAEWEHINRVLADCNYNISAAAKKLGIHRRTLQRKLYKFAPNK